jgi:hypothetical protein
MISNPQPVCIILNYHRQLSAHPRASSLEMLPNLHSERPGREVRK